jgi:hypothetical protein
MINLYAYKIKYQSINKYLIWDNDNSIEKKNNYTVYFSINLILNNKIKTIKKPK